MTKILNQTLKSEQKSNFQYQTLSVQHHFLYSIKPDAKVWAKIQFSVSNTFCTASLSVQYQTLCVQYQTLSVQYHFLYSITFCTVSNTFCTVSLSVQYQTLSVQYHFLYSIKHFMYSIKHSVYSIKHCVQYQTFSVYSIKHFLYSIKHYQTLQYQCLIKCLILDSVW